MNDPKEKKARLASLIPITSTMDPTPHLVTRHGYSQI